MEIALEELRNGDIGLNEASLPSLSSSKIYLKRHLDGKNYFSMENNQVIAEWELDNLLQLKQYVFYITITYLGSLVSKVGELNHFLMHTIKTDTAGSK